MTIAMRELGFAYGRLPVLHDVTAEAPASRVTALIGPNASGKSTLLRCAIGALPPRSGAATIDGRPAHRMAGRTLARRIAYVSQRPAVSAAFTVREVVALGRFALDARPDRVDEALERLALTGVADRPYPALSVGQQQRVALARAVAQLEPDGNLVLDEPTAAMDLRFARSAFAILRELAGRGATVLVAVHDLAAAAAVADRAWLLAPGAPDAPSRLIADGPAEDVMQAERLQDVFAVPFERVTRADGTSVLIASDDRR